MQGPSTHPEERQASCLGAQRQVSSRASGWAPGLYFLGGRNGSLEDEAVSPGPSLGHVSLGVSSPVLATGLEVGSGTQGQPRMPARPPPVCPVERVCHGPSSVRQALASAPPPGSHPPCVRVLSGRVCLTHVWVRLNCYLRVAKRACYVLVHVPMAVDTEPPTGPCVACQGGVPGLSQVELSVGDEDRCVPALRTPVQLCVCAVSLG